MAVISAPNGGTLVVPSTTIENRWDEKAGLRGDAVRSQISDVLEACALNTAQDTRQLSPTPVTPITDDHPRTVPGSFWIGLIEAATAPQGEPKLFSLTSRRQTVPTERGSAAQTRLIAGDNTSRQQAKSLFRRIFHITRINLGSYHSVSS